MVSFCTERNSGLMRLTISRTGKARFYISKFLTSFICGGLAALFGAALYGTLVWIIFPSRSSHGSSDNADG